MKLNFSFKELCHSDTATAFKFSNVPETIAVMDNLLNLIVCFLQPLREKLNKPITVTSGFRNTRLNRLVGGSSSSGHLLGRCADIKVNGMSTEALYQYIKNSGLKYRQLIQEKNEWVHIDYCKTDLRCENLRYDGKRYTKD